MSGREQSAHYDIRDIQHNELIDSVQITFVAVKGYGNDWAVYWFPANNNQSDWLPDRLQWIASNGTKLSEFDAKQIFPNIGGGPYRA